MTEDERWERMTGLALYVILTALLALVVIFVVVSGKQAAAILDSSARISSSYPHVSPTKPYFFPRGGRMLFPDYRLIALYGTPDEPVLGALGEQPVDATIARVKELAAQYQPLMTEHALPAMEIITTVASAYPTENGNYSQAVDMGKLQPWITAARKDGVYVVLDLQPGRNDFLSQAKQYKSLLVQPNVGLALDPEWRLTPTEMPLKQIGTVDTSEINGVVAWLADLVKADKLPQKLFLLHQFSQDMITGRTSLDTSRAELAYAIQMDGQGTQPEKLDTWKSITANPPADVHFGWKNFYKEDQPTLSPAATMQLNPEPWYISYQ